MAQLRARPVPPLMYPGYLLPVEILHVDFPSLGCKIAPCVELHFRDEVLKHILFHKVDFVLFLKRMF